METDFKNRNTPPPLSVCILIYETTPSLIPGTYTWITVCMFPWYLICTVVSLADFWSPLRCDSVDHISHTPHRPNVLTAYFLMSGRTQSVCSVKSTICLRSPISCAAHSHTVLLTQNKDGLVSLFVKRRWEPPDQIPVKILSTAMCVLQGMSHLWSLRCGISGGEWLSNEKEYHLAFWRWGSI